MTRTAAAKRPFRFYTRLHLTKLTGLKAATLEELADLLRQVPGSSVYHHTHRFLQQHQYLSPEPPNDFAFWAANLLGDDELGERLASIDVVQFASIRALRTRILEVLDEHLAAHPSARRRFADPGDEFHFMQSVSFILPTRHTAVDLAGFAEQIGQVSLDSVYFHMVESRLRLRKRTNDFSFWFETSLGRRDLAERVAGLDPYTTTLAGLRETLRRLAWEAA